LANKATILIVTKNRKDDVRRAIETSLMQTVPLAVLVIDDASTDGTPEMIRADFPQVQLQRSEKSQGYIGHRNRAADLARTPIVITLDDDAGFETPHTVKRVLEEFDEPRVGAIAIPFVDTLNPDVKRHLAPDREHVWVGHRFTGAAHALRRELFLKLGGFRESLVHFGEEDDYAIRLLAAGYVTRQSSSDPGYHKVSPLRNFPRERFWAARNVIYWSWLNLPARKLPLRLAGVTVREGVYAMRYRLPWTTLKGLARGYRDSLFRGSERKPIPLDVYNLWLEIRTRGMVKLDEILGRLPPMQ
jgi:GT2 family glycosyltransferase